MTIFKNTVCKLLLVFALTWVFTGCATYKMSEAPPRVEKETLIKFSEKNPSGMNDLPIGVYQVPGSRVIISGNFKGGMAGMFFGLTGVLLQEVINSSSAKKTVVDVESQLRWDLNKDLTEISKEILNSDAKFSQLALLEDGGGDTGFLINNYLLLDYVKDEGVTPYIVFKVMKLESSKKVWTARYIANAGETRNMVGEGGWIDDDNQELKNGVKTAMTKALTFLYNDMVNPYPRTREKKALIKLKAQYPYINNITKLPGWILNEDENQMVFIPKAGDAIVFAGVNIYSKADVEIVK